MKKNLFLAVFMISFCMLKAQMTNLIFFTEGGEKFYVILNGVLQNEKSETNVKVTELPAPSYKLKILFEDSTIIPLEKNLMFNQGTETTFNIKKNNKDEFVVRYLNEVPIAQAPVPPATQTVVIFSASGPAAPVHPVATTIVSTTQTTTTTAGTTAPVEGVSMGINVGDGQQNLNMNLNVSGTNTNMTGTSTTSSYSQTTTTTTTTGVNTQPVYIPPQPANPLPGYSGAIGCPYPMSPNDFEALKGSISSKSFDDSKLTLAKQVIATNCLLCSQLREVMLLFSFEDTKLELAKYAYGYTYDLGNYFKVNDAFTFESSIDELNEYITGVSK